MGTQLIVRLETKDIRLAHPQEKKHGLALIVSTTDKEKN
jgi:membrane carboxypeptidase/penicillin-binding protein PbpC